VELQLFSLDKKDWKKSDCFNSYHFYRD